MLSKLDLPNEASARFAIRLQTQSQEPLLLCCYNSTHFCAGGRLRVAEHWTCRASPQRRANYICKVHDVT